MEEERESSHNKLASMSQETDKIQYYTGRQMPSCFTSVASDSHTRIDVILDIDFE